MNALMGEDIEESGDYIVNEKEKNVNLTEDGVKKVEKFFHLDNLADPKIWKSSTISLLRCVRINLCLGIRIM